MKCERTHERYRPDGTVERWTTIEDMPESRYCPYCRRPNCADDPCSTELMRRAEHEPDYGGAFDGNQVYSDADPGL